MTTVNSEFLTFRARNTFTPASTVAMPRARERVVDGVREYLVEFEDLERRWLKEPKIYVTSVQKGGHWRAFSLLSLRHLRLFDLRTIYQFSKDNLETYSGLSGVDPNRPGSRTVNRYQYGSLNGDMQIKYQRDIAETYLKRLLKSRKYERLSEV